MCPHLDGSPEDAVCNAAKDFIRNLEIINLKICMSRHFESCYIYFLNLKEMSSITVSQKDRDGKY
jgi:hypothetical protein